MMAWSIDRKSTVALGACALLMFSLLALAYRGQTLTEDIRRRLAEVDGEEAHLAQLHLATSEAEIRSSFWALSATGLLAFGTLAATLFLVNREASRKRRLAEDSLQLASAEGRRLHESQKVAHVGSWETDLETLSVTWTDETHRIFETNPAIFRPTHQGFLELVHPDDRTRVNDAFVQSRGKHGSFVIEHRIMLGNGRVKIVEECWETANDSAGRPARAVGTCRDITVRKQAEAALLKSESRFRRIMESNMIGMFFWTINGGVDDANDAFLQMIGYTREDVRGGRVRWSEITPAEFQALDEIALKEIAATGKCSSYEKEYFRKDGSRVAILIGATAFENEPGHGVAYVLDITQRKQSEIRVRYLNRIYAVLSDINHNIVREQDREKMLMEACRIAVAKGGFLMAWIGFQDPGDATMHVAAHAGLDESHLEKLNGALATGTAPHVPTIEAMRSGEHVIVNDTEHDPRTTSWREFALSLGIRAYAAFPIKVDGHALGTFNFSAGETGYFTEEELRLLDELALDIGYALEVNRRKAERQLAENNLLASEMRYRRLFESAKDGILILNGETGAIMDANPFIVNLLGYTLAECIGKKLWEIGSFKDTVASQDVLRKLQQQQCVRYENLPLQTNMGKAIWVDFVSNVYGVGETRVIQCNIRDITEKRNLEEQFLRAQRLESLGTLAGGIAHDLNNVLAPILLSINLLKTGETDKGRLRTLSIIGSSAQRGADMVKQVLSFARGVEGQRLPVDIRRLIRDMEKIVNDTFLKNIQVRVSIDPEIGSVSGDVTQLHQALLNLCVNARDAMPDGGVLTLSAENVVLDEDSAKLHLGAKPGTYVMLRIEDTGTGIPRDVIDKIFEPFFTTKEIGKGTGLGLSTSLAVAKSHGGFLRVDSEPGRGTTFTLYLPAAAIASTGDASLEVPALPRGNGELILVVDDEDAVRQLTRQILESFGYRVLLATDGSDALVVFAAQPHDISLVLTDMMMPTMDGNAVIRVLRKLRPDICIIAASGLAENTVVEKAMSGGVKHFLTKPYTADVLLNTVREALSPK